MKGLYIWVALFLHAGAFAQISVEGQVLDATTGAPLEFVNVYLEGTSQGTVTDARGQFSLRIDRYPALLVFSHLNYTPTTRTVDQSATWQIALRERENIITGVEITDRNQRARNLDEFRRLFLGTDTWGQSARLLNEEALLFERDYANERASSPAALALTDAQLSDLTNVEWATDRQSFTYDKTTHFRVRTRAPLELDLPHLGYKITLELTGFVYDYALGSLSYLGYFFFQPYEAEGQVAKSRHRYNREQAYYHSYQHFARSLFHNALTENGYAIWEKATADAEREAAFVSVDLHDYLTYQDPYTAMLTGLQGRSFTILYHADAKGRPRNLYRHKSRQPARSELTVAEPVCTIRADGTLADQFMLFAGALAQKTAAYLLPSDYQPDR